MTDLNRLAGLTATELTLLFATPQTAPADMGHGDWLAVVQLLTARLTQEAKSLSVTELNRGVEVLGGLLDQAEQVGGINHDEVVIRRLHLTTALFDRRGSDPDVVLLDPRQMYELFLGAVPFTLARVREFPADWRTLDIGTVRRLRLMKNLLTPLLGAKSHLAEAGLGEEVSAWEEIMPRLP